jgi:hypothetical protein
MSLGIETALILFSLSAYGDSPRVHTIDNRWRLTSQKNETVFSGGYAHSQILHLRGPASQVTFIAKPAAPVSIRSVVNRIHEASADPKTLKTLKKKGHPTAFVFRTEDQVHWFSVKGGHLVATSNSLNQKLYKALLLKVEANP